MTSAEQSADQRTESRQPIDAAALRALLAADGLDGEVRLLDSCDSTNRVAAELPPAATQAQGWALVAAEEQTAGRGRMGRTWGSPRGAGLLFSVLLDVPTDTSPSVLALVPLATGLAVVEACRAVGAGVVLKWPNDIVAIGDDGELTKVGGILAEQRPRGLVVGVGLNHSLRRDEWPPLLPGALPPASLRDLADGADRSELADGADRSELLARCVAGIVRQFAALRADPAAVLAAYRLVCASLGRPVRVEIAGREPLEGVVAAVDDGGHLVVRDATGTLRPVTAGDVRHLPQRR